MDAIFKAVADDYAKTKNTVETAKNLNLSQAKVKKILITLGLYKNALSVRIARLAALGFTPKSIAENLNVSTKVVSANMPYTKTIYNGDNPTVNALRIRKTREKQKNAERTVENEI